MDLNDAAIRQRRIALQQQLETEQLHLVLAPDALDELRRELADVERTLDRNYTYFLPLTRRRLKAQAGDLHRRIALQVVELEEIRALHPGLETGFLRIADRDSGEGE